MLCTPCVGGATGPCMTSVIKAGHYAPPIVVLVASIFATIAFLALNKPYLSIGPAASVVFSGVSLVLFYRARTRRTLEKNVEDLEAINAGFADMEGKYKKQIKDLGDQIGGLKGNNDTLRANNQTLGKTVQAAQKHTSDLEKAVAQQKEELVKMAALVTKLQALAKTCTEDVETSAELKNLSLDALKQIKVALEDEAKSGKALENMVKERSEELAQRSQELNKILTQIQIQTALLEERQHQAAITESRISDVTADLNRVQKELEETIKELKEATDNLLNASQNMGTPSESGNDQSSKD